MTLGRRFGSADGGRPREPYTSPQDLIRDHVDAIRMRAQVALEIQQGCGDETTGHPWPLSVLEAEARIAHRLHVSRLDTAIHRIRDRFGLSSGEERVLWTLLAFGCCPTVREYMSTMANRSSQAPTLDVIRRISHGSPPSADAAFELGPKGALRRYEFIERTDADPLAGGAHQTWRLSPRVIALVNGDPRVDPAIDAQLISPTRFGHVDSIEVGRDVRERTSEAFDRSSLVLAVGRSGSGRRSLLVATAIARGLSVMEIDARSLKPDERARRELRIFARECRLYGATPLIRNLEAVADRMEMVEAELRGLTLATARVAFAHRWRRAPTIVELDPLPHDRLAALWDRTRASGAPPNATLPTPHPLAPAVVVTAARGLPRDARPDIGPKLAAAALDVSIDERFIGLACRDLPSHRDTPRLSDEQQRVLNSLRTRIQERMPVLAVFSGPRRSGTRAAASWLARELLRLPLYRTSLRRFGGLSTDQCARRFASLLDTTEATCAVLLIEHADFLIRGRGDAHAGIASIASLVTQLAAFRGACVMTAEAVDSVDDRLRDQLTAHLQFTVLRPFAGATS